MDYRDILSGSTSASQLLLPQRTFRSPSARLFHTNNVPRSTVHSSLKFYLSSNIFTTWYLHYSTLLSVSELVPVHHRGGLPSEWLSGSVITNHTNSITLSLNPRQGRMQKKSEGFTEGPKALLSGRQRRLRWLDWEGIPLPSRLGGLGVVEERRGLSKLGPGRSPGRKRLFSIF